MVKYALALTIVGIIITACADQVANTPTNAPANISSLVTSFPQLINTPSAYLEALFTGELVLDNGCLRVNDADGFSVLLIWRPDFSTRTEQGIVQIVDSTGQVTASVGDFVEVGGGFTDNPTPLGLAEPLPEDCPGSYWLVGEWIRKVGKP